MSYITTYELEYEQGFSISKLGCSLRILCVVVFLQFLYWLKFSRLFELVSAMCLAIFQGRHSPYTTSGDGYLNANPILLG